MKRRHAGLSIAVVGLLSIQSSTAHAIVGEENAHLAAIVANQLRELKELKTVIMWLRDTAQATNEGLAVARQAVRIFEAIKNYSPEQLLADARRGLAVGFPEAAALDREIAAGIANRKAIYEGDDAFWRHGDHHDPKAKALVESVYSVGYSGLAKTVLADEHAERPSSLDWLLTKHYMDAGEAYRLAARKGSLGILAQKAQTLVEDSELRSRVDHKARALALQTGVETAASTGELAQLKRIETGREEARRIQEETFNRRVGDGLSRHARRLFRFLDH